MHRRQIVMKRRSFIKGVTAAGAVSILPANLITGCKESHAAGSWDFDEVINRSGTWSIKYGRAGKDRLAMWIAVPWDSRRRSCCTVSVRKPGCS